MWRRKSVPAWLGEELVPVVHGRGLWAHGVERMAPPFWWPLGLGFVFGFALLEPEALAIHLENVEVMGQAVEERGRPRRSDPKTSVHSSKGKLEVTRIEPRSQSRAILSCSRKNVGSLSFLR